MKAQWQRDGTFEISIAVAALAEIQESCVAVQGTETGGVLVGGNTPPRRWQVERTFGPGPVAKHSKASFEWDARYILGVCDAVRAVSPLSIIGRWHSHESGSLYASDIDRRSALAFLGVLGLSRMLDIIVTTNNKGQPDAVVCYVAYSDGGYIRSALYTLGIDGVPPVGWKQTPREHLSFLPSLGDDSFDVFLVDGEHWWIDSETMKVYRKNRKGFCAPSWSELPAEVRAHIRSCLTGS